MSNFEEIFIYNFDEKTWSGWTKERGIVKLSHHWTWLYSEEPAVIRECSRICKKRYVVLGKNLGDKYASRHGYIFLDSVYKRALDNVKNRSRNKPKKLSSEILEKRRRNSKSKFIQKIHEIFPYIPDEDAEGIADHTLDVAKRRVGATRKLSLEERVRRATVAHVRHVHTDYEMIFRELYDAYKEDREMDDFNEPFDKEAAKYVARSETAGKVREILKLWGPD